jgi:hypothetical protein
MDYTRTTLAEVRAGLDRIAVETEATLGALGRSQLNWRPDESTWSVAQCLQHLVTVDNLMMQAAERALAPGAPATVWQRLPLLPGVIGPMMVRSQAPETTRRFVAPPSARPTSDIGTDIVRRFIEQQRTAAKRLETLDERQAARTRMVSPFLRFVAYSVLDGWRLFYAHDLRHLQQARRVLALRGVVKSV